MSILAVNAAALPAPTTLSVQLDDALQSVQTTLSGQSYVSSVAVKRRISAHWAYMSPDNLKSLLGQIALAPTFSLTFPDPLTGASLTVTAYAQHKSVGLYRMQNGAPVWTNIEMTFIEA